MIFCLGKFVFLNRFFFFCMNRVPYPLYNSKQTLSSPKSQQLHSVEPWGAPGNQVTSVYTMLQWDLSTPVLKIRPKPPNTAFEVQEKPQETILRVAGSVWDSTVEISVRVSGSEHAERAALNQANKHTHADPFAPFSMASKWTRKHWGSNPSLFIWKANKQNKRHNSGQVYAFDVCPTSPHWILMEGNGNPIQTLGAMASFIYGNLSIVNRICAFLSAM